MYHNHNSSRSTVAMQAMLYIYKTVDHERGCWIFANKSAYSAAIPRIEKSRNSDTDIDLLYL